MKIVVLALLMSFPLTAGARSACVILLHGLLLSDGWMEKMEKAIARAGFATVNVDYPSTKHPIEELAGPAIAPALDRCRGYDEIHFVAHSLGSILVRYYLGRVPVENLGRVVMLGPPNKGSEVADRLEKLPGFHFVFGDAGQQLGTGRRSLPKRLGAANFDLGIIAGICSIHPIFSHMIPAVDDGIVSVESTRLQGMHDHLQIPATHLFMIRNKEVITQVIHYLRCGEFNRS
ncbi:MULTISPECIES: alpha/beta hydrolase [unclassified Microbulbifer]|uniref:esterase/lipase family protein n=1 Tax=unclassified Microbulbifer TaxID=2619833 RepID=UPI0027E4AF14|nr:MULTISPECIES: alpha/beta hydrolase [unclassified Microbulbifer]